MIQYIAYNDAGKEIQRGSCAENVLEHLREAYTWVIQVNSLQEHLNSYLHGGEILPIPDHPSEFHYWDWTSKTWVPDVVKARESRKAEVDSERERHSVLPLTFDGKLLDADLKAQKNLSDKLQEVRERLRLNIPMPMELLVWRDADNVTHTFIDLQSYHDWLSSFAIAIAERGTRLYTQAWQHKYNIDQLSSIEELLNYSISFE